METIDTKRKVFTNLSWKLAERFGAQGVEFIVSIVLARLLLPEAYGTVALLNVFIIVLGVFTDSGFGSALVQKKDADDLDFSTIFYFNLAFCSLIYLGIFLCAPAVAAFYKNPDMTAMLRVMGISIIVSGIKNIESAYVKRKMIFKRFFFATLGGTVGAAFLGIAMAMNGFGAWALIAQSLFNNTVDTVILWFTVKWRPKPCFSLSRLKSLFSFGWKLLVSSILDKLYNNVRPLIIGKFYTSSDLAYYNRGRSWPILIMENINSSIDSVLFPAISTAQDNPTAVKNMTRRAIKTSTYIVAPMMMGLAAVSLPLVRLILTEKWIDSVLFMRIFCITYMFYPIHTSNLSAIVAIGRSDLFLKLEIIKKVVGLAVLAVTAPISVEAMGYSLLFTSLANQIINSWPNKKLLKYSYFEQLKDIMPAVLLAVAMGGCIFPIQWLGLPDTVTLLIQVPLGALLYIAGSKLFKIDSFDYIWSIVKPLMKKVFHKA